MPKAGLASRLYVGVFSPGDTGSQEWTVAMLGSSTKEHQGER